MLGNQCKNQHLVTEASYLLLNVFLIVCKFIAQTAAYFNCLIMILNEFNPAENYNTAEIKSPFTFISFSAAGAKP